MLIDTALLRRAPLPNLERLARSLAIDMPAARRKARRECVAWHWALVLLLAARLRRDAAAAQVQTDSAGVVVTEMEVADK